MATPIAVRTSMEGMWKWLCLECDERFPERVWHCPVCDHHWPMQRRTCHNCHEHSLPGPAPRMADRAALGGAS